MDLNKPVGEILRLRDKERAALKTLSISTAGDLLFYFPKRYIERGEERLIETAEKDSVVTFSGKITRIKTKKAFRRRIPMAEGELEDETGKVRLVWFNQPYMAKMYPEGTLVRVSGKLKKADGKSPELLNPSIEKLDELPRENLFGDTTIEKPMFLTPIYGETKGITSNFIYHAVEKLVANGALDGIREIIPEEVSARYSLPARREAVLWAHFPKTDGHAIAARKRFAFEEIFLIQLARQKERLLLSAVPGYTVGKKTVSEFLKRFPFSPTKAQDTAIEAILGDMEKGVPMSRLLEGDVGSGKTLVAAAAAYATAATRPDKQDFGTLQVAYMAPTEILAKQHFENFIGFFDGLGVNIGLITSSGCMKYPSKTDPTKPTPISRPQLLKWVANGEIAAVVGTHSLIRKSIVFKHLALVIIDEQHRFGTKQRKELVRKESNPRIPHLLSMTATPIPRTLALTVYGDLDLTLLDEMPAGRKPIKTELVAPEKRDGVYEKIRGELEAGKQAYIICPRIDTPDKDNLFALEAKSAKEEAKRLKKDVFKEFEIGLLHSKMKPKEKDDVMKKFADGKINILVATSVVEVGVNVPNATIIVIEGSERFGLAQLHQLRGRVLRSSDQAYCYLFTGTKSENSTRRLKALQTAKNGFELAEVDLKIRGGGELSGGKQSGLTDLGMEAIQNLKLVEAARNEAKKLLEKDPELKQHKFLKETLENREKIHLE